MRSPAARIDDRVVGTTPLTTTVTPGDHDLYVETTDGRSFDRTITAEDGVTIAVGTDLGEPSGNPRPTMALTKTN